MLHKGIIGPVSGPWAAPVVIVNKPPREPRFCVDFRCLNLLTAKDSYPLPRVDKSLDFLSREKFITTLDLARGYWQVAVAEESRTEQLSSLSVVCFSLESSPLVFAMHQ